MSKTVRLTNAVDTYADAAKPSRYNYNATQIAVESGQALGYLYFPFPVPRGATILSAILRLRTAGSFGGASLTLSAQRVATRFVLTKTNWTNKPGVAGTAGQLTQASSGNYDYWDIDVAAALQPVADGAAPWYGFRLASSSGTRRAWHSANSPVVGARPELIVTYTEAPDVPTTLTPSDGQAVNAEKPVLEMNYTDTSGSKTLAGLRVWVGTDPALVGAWDSGEVLAEGSVARLDLATTTYPGHAEGATIYWRGQVKDAAGEWSGLSAITSFVRSIKGTVTIDSPSALDPVLNDFTPPLLWTPSFVGSKWQAIVTRVDTGATVFDSGEVPGTESEVTVADAFGGALLTTGIEYLAEVRVWDTEDRIGTVNDPAYSFDTQAFTVEPGATTGVTGLHFEQSLTPFPALVVEFDRTEAPDAFTILRDGVPVATNVEPSDFEHVGTTWTYRLGNVRPNIDNEIGVSAIVDGVASPISTAVGRLRVSGLWLVDLDGEHSLFLASTSGSSYALKEEGDTIVPLGASSGFRITQGLRGYEGTISGVVLNEAGKTRDEWIEEALAMRGEPGKKRRLIVGTEAFDVVCWDMTVRPTGDSSPGLRPVSFEFMQIDRHRSSTIGA